MNDIIKAESTALSRVEPDANAGQFVANLLQQAIAAGQPVRELAEVFVKMQDRAAEAAFNRAFVELQRDIPKVRAVKQVPNNDGTIRFAYAPFDEIDAQVRPLCLRHGFTYTFSDGPEAAGKVTKICTLRHVGGHSVSNSYSVRVGKGPPGCTEAQVDGAAHSYAKRGALCDALNIVVERNMTALNPFHGSSGRCITLEQAEELERRVKLTNSNVEAFLRFAGADMTATNRWLTIPAERYSQLDAELKKKERR